MNRVYRDRKKQLLLIVILLISVVGLSIGLATFSSVLTISSKATVKPNADEYNLTIYGFTVDPQNNDFTTLEEVFAYTSKNVSLPFGSSGTEGSNALIDNIDFKISNVSVNFYGKESETVNYYFLIINEGAYDIYLNLSNLGVPDTTVSKTCTAVGTTSQTLVDESCDAIKLKAYLGEISDNTVNIFQDSTLQSHKIVPGGVVMLNLVMSSHGGSITADGEFSVSFDDLLLDFNSTDIYSSSSE